MKKVNVVMAVSLLMSIAISASAAELVNLLNRGDVEGGWSFVTHDPARVSESFVGNGRGGYGNALSFTDSVWDENWASTSLRFVSGNGIAVFANRIPNNSTVYVGAWVKVSSGFAPGQVDIPPTFNSGVEVYLQLSEGAVIEAYQSNTDVDLTNSLTFGFDDVNSIPISSLTTSWQYFEYPVQVGDSGSVDGWGYVEINVSDRVGWRGDLAAAFTGTIYFDDIYIGVLPQADPQQCGDSGTTYLAADLNHDCYVNFEDMAKMAQNWVKCTNPADTACNQYWK